MNTEPYTIEDLATEVARLDRAHKTAEAHLKAIKEKMIAAMDEAGATMVYNVSGKATVTLVNGERLSVDYDTLEETDSEIASEIRVRKADLDLFRAAITSGRISTTLANSCSKAISYRQIRVTRK
jgi:hypothetical protein